MQEERTMQDKNDSKFILQLWCI